jgi:hypothetical protein
MLLSAPPILATAKLAQYINQRTIIQAFAGKFPE